LAVTVTPCTDASALDVAWQLESAVAGPVVANAAASQRAIISVSPRLVSRVGPEPRQKLMRMGATGCADAESF